MPAGPGSDLVLIEADPLLGQFEDLLTGPARTDRPDDLSERGVGRSVDQVVGELVGVGDAAADHDGVDPAVAERWSDWDAGPVIRPLALRPIATAQALPLVRLQHGRDAGHRHLPRRAVGRPGGRLLRPL